MQPCRRAWASCDPPGRVLGTFRPRLLRPPAPRNDALVPPSLRAQRSNLDRIRSRRLLWRVAMAFRILSLDGGGSWALIQVRALIELCGEATQGHEVLRQFDLAAAC